MISKAQALPSGKFRLTHPDVSTESQVSSIDWSLFALLRRYLDKHEFQAQYEPVLQQLCATAAQGATVEGRK